MISISQLSDPWGMDINYTDTEIITICPKHITDDKWPVEYQAYQGARKKGWAYESFELGLNK